MLDRTNKHVVRPGKLRSSGSLPRRLRLATDDDAAARLRSALRAHTASSWAALKIVRVKNVVSSEKFREIAKILFVQAAGVVEARARGPVSRASPRPQELAQDPRAGGRPREPRRSSNSISWVPASPG
jgi:hypothetical protein